MRFVFLPNGLRRFRALPGGVSGLTQKGRMDVSSIHAPGERDESHS